MNRYDFDVLLQKYLDGKCTQEEKRQVEIWSDELLQNSKITLEEEELKSIRNRIWVKLSGVLPNKKNKWKQYWTIAAAAVIVCCLGIAAWLIGSSESLETKRLAIEDTEINTELLGDDLDYITVTTKNTERVIKLEDGTIIKLGVDSKLKYPVQFNRKHRKVQLEGEAFFEVAKDMDRPFLVFADDLVTQVLGTSFKVNSYPNAKSIRVSVLSGRVSVYENLPTDGINKNGVILTPNQQIIFEKASRKLVPELVNDPLVIHPPLMESQFLFVEVPLYKVIETVEHAFNVEIVLESPSLENCKFTGDLNELPLHTQLQLISSAVNGNYELRGTTFFLRGEACII